jgi:hypothetical protein
MRMLRWTVATVAALLVAGSLAHAGDLLAPSKSIDQAVDYYIDSRLKQAGVTPAPPADDANLLRRLSLDMVGRVPTAAETRAYLAATDPDKRAKLVDRLMASPAFTRHQANEFDVLLMAGTQRSLRDYLLAAFKENRSWDQVFRDLLLPDEKDPRHKGAVEFLKSRLKDTDRLTTEVSSIFFGVNVSCARCHDHPRVSDWKQDHFFGMKSFFARTFDNGGFLAERETGVVKFKTTGGAERQAKLMFLTGKVVEDAGAKELSRADQQKEKAELDRLRRQRMPPPPPRFSARAQLVELALQPGQRDFFSRSIVNRVWQRLFGQGLVMPVDQMHSENPASHPDLLRWLARDMEEHKYDLRRLIRGLVLSRAYARSSRWEEAKVPAPELYAAAQVRPLTPIQLSASLEIVTTSPASLAADLKPDELERRIENLESRARGLARYFEQPGDNFQVSVSEALLFSNGDRIVGPLLADSGDRLVGHLKQIKDRKDLIDLAVRNALSRPATEEEVKLLADYLDRRKDRPVEACRQLVWALLTSSEFRFNY